MNNEEGMYIYAIIDAEEPQEFELVGIGGRGDRVYTVHHGELAAVVSSSPIIKYPVSRENTMVHQKVLEEVMEKFTVLPVRFCTIAENEEDIKEKVLKARYEEFKNLLEEMRDKVELGIRAIWTNTEEIFAEIIKENNPIKQLKEKIAKGASSPSRKRAGMMEVGEMVQQALEKKKEKEAQELLAVLKPLSVDFREKEVYGDRNIANFAFLVKKANEGDFDEKIRELAKSTSQEKSSSTLDQYHRTILLKLW